MTGLPAAQLTDANAERDLKLQSVLVELEIAGLQALVDTMGADVTKAIDIIARVKGRVVISGMGKVVTWRGKLLRPWHLPGHLRCLFTRARHPMAIWA